MNGFFRQFWFVLCLCGLTQGAVQIDFFYEPGCRDCERIEQEILPRIEERFGGSCAVESYDIGLETNFMYLLQLEDAAGYTGADRSYLVIEKQHFFGASPDVEKLFAVISELAGQTREDSQKDAMTNRSGHGFDSSIAEERFRDFTWPAVIAAGFLDGINPCAISTLVFFMSLLAVSKVRNRQLILLGVSFCTASFVTYLALGFGLVRVLHLFAGYKMIRSAIEWGTIAILLVLSVLSFRDAFRFRKSHDGHDVTLQLSTGMKKRIHTVMRRGLKTGHLVLGGLFIGMLVTALESVCTGQVYVPTLVLILKDKALTDSRAWLFLIVYNLLFVLPLVLIFTAVYFGLRAQTLILWSRRNVAVSKILLGFFFVLMALLILRF
ncbi:cytochrome c biogenesis CcdA family protein [Tichowtungia aerotolerans]|uniref:Cytochrome C biogenesis protein transmembrane domain-containing protein n=1 Tax=Tichowtungia aerotolerans TaxID=2697043 RepID=A0A6P1M952_9BACT|nr:hypothetical protein [Tichowtungia aerotolerans]QHI69074.1 hypothetical protein GT409_06315 [Tichowtungia aerotolerans]